jgi:CRP/FNR family transcriptional regulator
MLIGKKINTCTVGLDKCTCFESLKAEELDLINRNLVEVEFKKGETICKQGTFATHVMYLSKGLTKVFMEGQQETLVLKIIPEDNLIGLTALFNETNVFQYSVAAYVDSLVKLINIDVFRQVLAQNAKFASEIINILNANTVQTYGRFYCLTQKQAYGRLADIILCLADRIYKEKEFELLLSRKDFAELSGMTTENVIRMLKKFKDDKLIKIEGKKFKILKYDKLQEISNYG